jgi:hypothetical protein
MPPAVQVRAGMSVLPTQLPGSQTVPAGTIVHEPSEPGSLHERQLEASQT